MTASTEDIEDAHGEWDYETAEHHITGDEYPVSIPCQLRFVEETNQDTERFHEALESRGYSPLDSNPTRNKIEGKPELPYYDGEVMIQDVYHRVKVLVFRGELVRLYPHDDYVPSVDELAALVKALEEGFGATLEHDSIESEKT